MTDSPNRRRRRRRPPTPEVAVRRALRNLARAAEAFAEKRRGATPESLRVELPLSPTDAEGWTARGDAFLQTLARSLQARPDGVEWRDGAMFCFQCGSARCAHASPPDARHVFAGYPPTGKPTWIDFLEQCVQRRPPGLDRLFADRPGVVVFAEDAEALTEGLLPGFGRGEVGYTVLGQVAVGLLPATLGAEPTDERVAMTVQIVETRAAGGERLRLNLLGIDQATIVRAAADGQPRNPAEQLRRTLARTRQTLASIVRRLATAQARGEPTEAGPLVSPVLSRLRGDLGRIFNPDARRTRHAETRHRGGHRPTSTSWRDAAEASDERLFADTRRGTVIVLGRRNRAHVFARDGRHVTSLRLAEGELDRKLSRRRWVPLEPEAVRAFRAAVVEAGSASDP